MGRELVIALAGNPNSGKTTIFNALTGAKQKVGNWPGVTVEKKEGELEIGDRKVRVVDLPGTYSLTASSIDERIARDFVIKERPFLVLVVLDSSNIERNLYLALRIMELGTSRVILIFNMMDVAKSKGMKIRSQEISNILRVPVIETVANKGIGVDALKDAIKEEIDRPEGERAMLTFRYGEVFEEAIQSITEAVMKDKELVDKYPIRWFVLKLMEEDEEYLALVERSPYRDKIKAVLELWRSRLEDDAGYDMATSLIEKRYGYIHGLVKECVTERVNLTGILTLSDKIDKVVTHRVLGIPIFLFFMWLTFKLTFSLGGPISDIIDSFMSFLADKAGLAIQALHGSKFLVSFVTDGVIGGVGSVLVFLPNIFILFLAIAVLEDSGYMARGAFVMDRFMHAMGLHGKSFIPMLLGFGCNIPAVMATRTLENRGDRIVTILVNPLMSCSARLPIYILFAGAFFSSHQGTIIFSLYTLGVVLAMILARVFKSLFFKGEPAPLIMELPPYHLPTFKSVFLLAWQRSAYFLKKAGTTIFGVVIIVWILASLPLGVEYGSQESLVGRFGTLLAPILKPAGFGFWQAAVALFFGFLAKEVVVGTFGTLYHTGEEKLSLAISQHFNPLTAYAFMVFSLIYVPCVATIAVIKRETNSWKWTLFATGYSLVLAWILAVIVYQGGRILGL